MSKPSKCISKAKAKELQDNWVDTRANVIQTALGYEDTREFILNIAEIEEYIAYVKEMSQEQGVLTPGLRVYFGAYNDDISNFATIFIAPTMGNSQTSANNYTIDSLNMNQGGHPPHKYKYL